MERYFFLDDTDRELIQDKRRDHNRLGFAVRLTGVRFLGRFMADPRQVPTGVAEYLAEQLDITDASCLKPEPGLVAFGRRGKRRESARGGWSSPHRVPYLC
ncbi:DUF4158 domain-containing protein [Streptosporangium sp. CA-135522]|uniref:DUF4158 domain-containing protein n=1 Tax=Streptosporangium sp. CA-135522 TaxID=3240072 RepID=UPI003D8E8339